MGSLSTQCNSVQSSVHTYVVCATDQSRLVLKSKRISEVKSKRKWKIDSILLLSNIQISKQNVQYQADGSGSSKIPWFREAPAPAKYLGFERLRLRNSVLSFLLIFMIFLFFNQLLLIMCPPMHWPDHIDELMCIGAHLCIGLITSISLCVSMPTYALARSHR